MVLVCVTIKIVFFLLQSIHVGSYDHHAAIYYLLLDKLRSQLVGGENQTGVREVQRRRPSNVAEQAMRKIGRASTSEDCRRLIQHSTTAPTASNSKICSRPRTCDSPPTHGIDAAKLLAATNSEDALKILNQATTKTTFSMCNEATKLMSTLQMSAIPSASADTPLFKDYAHQTSAYSYLPTSISPQPIEIGETKGCVGRFCNRYIIFLLGVFIFKFSELVTKNFKLFTPIF